MNEDNCCWGWACSKGRGICFCDCEHCRGVDSFDIDAEFDTLDSLFEQPELFRRYDVVFSKGWAWPRTPLRERKIRPESGNYILRGQATSTDG